MAEGGAHLTKRSRLDGSTRCEQSPTQGRILIALSWIMRAIGTLIVIPAFWYDVNVDSPASYYSHMAISVPVLFAGMFLLVRSRRIAVSARPYLAKTFSDFDSVTKSSYVLYLRPFMADNDMTGIPERATGSGMPSGIFLGSWKTHEEKLIRRFRRLGHVIAVGDPRSTLPRPGAARGFLPDNGWQETVTRLIEGAHLVVMSTRVPLPTPHLGTGFGPAGTATAWEFTEALRILEPARLILLIYSAGVRELIDWKDSNRFQYPYEQFCSMAEKMYAHRSQSESGAPESGEWPSFPALPSYPTLSNPKRALEIVSAGRSKGDYNRWDFLNYSLRSIVRFNSTWQPITHVIDPTRVIPFNTASLQCLDRWKFMQVMSKLRKLPAKVPRTLFDE
jgi:hypothetical protein